MSLTDWANEPTLDDLKADFDGASSSHQSATNKITDWLNDINPNDKPVHQSGSPFEKGNNATSKKPKTRSSLQSKLIRKQLEWRYTSLSEPFLNTPDIFNADPVTAEDKQSAEQNGLVLNNQVNTKMNKVAFVDEYVRTCSNEGTVFVKVGWDYRFEMIEKSYPVYEIAPAQTQEQASILEQYSQFHSAAMPDEIRQALQVTQETQVPHYPIQVGEETAMEESATRNHPSWQVCNYKNIRIDPTCNGNIEEAQFVVYSYESSKDALSKRDIYENLDKIKAESVNVGASHDSSWSGSGFEFQDDSRKKLVVHEYWGYWDIDNSGKTQPIVAEWVGEVLIRLELNPYPGGFLPFVAVPFMPVKNSIYGEPDGELLKENQQVSGALTRGIVDVFGRSANAQTGVRKGALDVLNKRRFDRGQDYEFNDAGDAQSSIYMHQFPEMPQSVYNFLNMQNQEAESLTGVLAFNQGITGSGLGDTAAAANGALSAAARRELGILRRLAEGMKRIGHKIVAMNQEFLDEEEVIRVTNENFVRVRRDDLQGHIDLRLSISTAEADEQKAKELAFMLQTAGPSLGIDFTKILLSEIATLRKMPVLSNEIKNFNPEPDPMQQQLQQLEMAQKQAEIEKIQAETQKVLADAQLSGVKSGESQATTAQQQLDTLEQESGVEHTRKMDVMESQAEAQARTKVVEATMNAAKDAANRSDKANL